MARISFNMPRQERNFVKQKCILKIELIYQRYFSFYFKCLVDRRKLFLHFQLNPEGKLVKPFQFKINIELIFLPQMKKVRYSTGNFVVNDLLIILRSTICTYLKKQLGSQVLNLKAIACLKVSGPNNFRAFPPGLYFRFRRCGRTLPR